MATEQDVTPEEKRARQHYDQLNGRINHVLKDEPLPVQIGVLLSCVLNCTSGNHPDGWIHSLMSFLTVIGRRDGLYVYTSPPDDTADDVDDAAEAGNGETMH